MTILVLAAVGYYGVNLGTVYIRYTRMKQAMQTEARAAPSISDEVIRRRLRAQAEELGLPPEAQRINIRRRTRPREIIISTEWQEAIELPFVSRIITFKPEVRALL